MKRFLMALMMMVMSVGLFAQGISTNDEFIPQNMLRVRGLDNNHIKPGVPVTLVFISEESGYQYVNLETGYISRTKPFSMNTFAFTDELDHINLDEIDYIRVVPKGKKPRLTKTSESFRIMDTIYTESHIYKNDELVDVKHKVKYK